MSGAGHRVTHSNQVHPHLPFLLLILLIIILICEYAQGNDIRPPSIPKNGTTRSPFEPTFATPAPTPVPQPPRGTSFGSRFLSFLRSVRGTLEDVVSDVDPGVDRVFYLERNETGDVSMDRMAEIILRKSSILTLGESRIIACRIYADPKTVTDKLEKRRGGQEKDNKDQEQKIISGQEMVNLINNCNDIDKMKPYMFPTLRTEHQLLSSDEQAEESVDIMNSTSRKSPAPGGEDEKSGVFDGVAIYPGTKWFVISCSRLLLPVMEDRVTIYSSSLMQVRSW